ncbi:MAG: hypothetical protein NVS2B16_07340 [Chloroflexota bacterium]
MKESRRGISVSRHTPHQINGEFLHTVKKGFAALAPTAPASIRNLRAPAIQQALLNTPRGSSAGGVSAGITYAAGQDDAGTAGDPTRENSRLRSRHFIDRTWYGLARCLLSGKGWT